MISVVQLGARMHYAVPRILESNGLLCALYTDATTPTLLKAATSFFPYIKRVPSLARLAGRFPAGVPRNKVRSDFILGVKYYAARRSARKAMELATAHISASRALCELAIADGFAGASGIYCFDSAALEAFHYAKQNGVSRILEQTIAPAAFHKQLLLEETGLWPGWSLIDDLGAFYEPFIEREREEWENATAIVCGSEFVGREVGQRTSNKTVMVVPYGVTLPVAAIPRVSKPLGTRLRVLLAGTVGLRKGAGYACEVARRCKDIAEFRWIGGFDLSPEGEKAVRSNIDCRGQVARDAVASHYEWADVLFLPSVCEGSATVVYEAIARGLPYLVTTNCGAPASATLPWVTDIRDVDKMVACIEKMASSREFYVHAAVESTKLREVISLDSYRNRLIAAISMVLGTK